MFGVASSEIGDLTGLAVGGPLCLSEEGEIRRMESGLRTRERERRGNRRVENSARFTRETE